MNQLLGKSSKYLAIVIAAFSLFIANLCADSAPAASDAEQNERQAVDQSIRHYFEVWSHNDLVGYASCFYPKAQIAYMSKTGQVSVLPLNKFVESQRQFLHNAKAPVSEIPESIEIERHEMTAHVRVHWKLDEGGKITRGWDFYTVLKVNGEWKISYLVFFSDTKN